MQPTKQVFTIARMMFEDAWNAQLQIATQSTEEVKRQLKAVEKKIESLLDRIVEAASPSVVRTFETRLAKLEREKIVLGEKAATTLPKKGRLEEFIELSLKFLSTPWFIYKNGDYVTRQTVLRLAFAEPLQYSRNEGYRIPKFSRPFKMLEGILGRKNEMVLLGRIELPTSPLPRVRSTTELQQHVVAR